jgi:nicotinamide-nucleotide adenylyltransferase
MANRHLAGSMHELRLSYQSALHNFNASPNALRVLETIPAASPVAQTHPTVLYVLDSSFNPPTLAHLRIASSALSGRTGDSSARLLLLLATQNADKPSKPASFEDRLVMMNLFARDLHSQLQGRQGQNDALSIDIGVTKKPYFIDKAAAIASSEPYSESLEQVHLTGFDTLVRIFDTKYYPPEHTLRPLEPFLGRHRMRVTLRPDDDWGGREEQESFLSRLAEGGRENEGGKREWATQITLVEGKKEGEGVISSTKAREAQTVAALEQQVTGSVSNYILSENLYRT